MSPLRLPTINAPRFLKTLIACQAQRKVQEFLDGLGPARVRFLIKHRMPFQEVGLQAWGADRLADLNAQAKHLGFMAQWYSDEDILGWTPDWTQRMLAELGEEERAWLRREILWLRTLFGSDRKEG